MGHGDYQYFPTLQATGPGLLEYLMLALLAAMLVMILPLAFLKRRFDLD